MILRGTKVFLRALEAKDAETLHQIALESLSPRRTTPYWHPWSVAEFASFAIGGYHTHQGAAPLSFRLGICVGDATVDAQLIGTIELHKIDWLHGHAEVGIVIWPEDAKRKGYGTDALGCLISWAFNTLRLTRLFAKTFSTNSLSIALFKKLGFSEEGTWREHYFLNGERVDAVLFGLLSREFKPLSNP